MGSTRPAASLDVEANEEHTRILRVTLAVEDCVSYWRARGADAAPGERVRTAFDRHWFGTKSEARVRTLLGDMELRFDRYPEALAALRLWDPPPDVAPWICHFHTQLADPIYRAFSGDFLPKRRLQGYLTIDREAVARWVEERWPAKWSASTCMKFASNMLAAAFEAGLLRDRKDPRKMPPPRAPKLALSYLLYLLRQVSIEGGILESAYLSSVLPNARAFPSELRGLEGVRLNGLGDVQNFEWAYPDLHAWASAQNQVKDGLRLRGAMA